MVFAIKIGKTREQYEEKLVEVVNQIKDNRDLKREIKRHVAKYKVTGGFVQRIFNSPEDEIPDLDTDLLVLIGDAVYQKSKTQKIKTDDFFTETEIKLAKQFEPEEETIELPYTFKNVLMVDSENYLTTISIKEIKKLWDSRLLRYNFETQREAKYTKDKKGNLQKEAKVNEKSVKEIKNHLLKGTLEPTVITFNCLAGTSDELEEIQYNPETQELTVTEGTMIDVLDGFHRITGALRALRDNPEIDFNFQLAIKNFNTKRAQQHVAQLNTINAMSSSRLKEMKEERLGDTVAKQLQRGALQGVISQGSMPIRSMGQVFTFGALADAIDEEFHPESKKEALEVSQYLNDFFELFMIEFEEFFIGNQAKNNNSLINSSTMIYGYIVLAKRAKDENVPISTVINVIKNIDFDRGNQTWQEIGLVDDSKNLKRRTKSIIKTYFRELKLDEGTSISPS